MCGSHQMDPNESRMVKLLRRRVPTTRHIVAAHLFVRARDVPEADRPAKPPLLRRRYATPMLAVLVVIESTDLIAPSTRSLRSSA